VFVTFEEMHLEDLSQVVEIEKVSFPTPWSRSAFACEILQNGFADYVVAKIEDMVVGYGGMWLILDEAHITNVAVRPGYRMKNIGRSLMMEIIRRAILMGVNNMTLEVRPTNTVARRLYTSLGFQEKGIRKGYYADTNEDAIIMWKEGLACAGRAFAPAKAARGK